MASKQLEKIFAEDFTGTKTINIMLQVSSDPELANHFNGNMKYLQYPLTIGRPYKAIKVTKYPSAQQVFVYSDKGRAQAFDIKYFDDFTGEISEDDLPCSVGDQLYFIQRYKSAAKVIKNTCREVYKTPEGVIITIQNLGRGLWGKDVFSDKKLAELQAEAEFGKFWEKKSNTRKEYLWTNMKNDVKW